MANSTGLSSASSPSLLAPAQSPGAFKNTIQRISAQGEAFALVAQVLNPMTDALNTLYKTLKQSVPQPEQYDMLDQSGNLIGFIGYTYSGNVLYEGAWFANLGIGGTIAAPIISVNGSTAQIVINSNGSIIIEDPNNNVTAEIGTIFDTQLNVTSISNATPPVVTLASTPAVPFQSGNSVVIAGNSVPAYNRTAYITVLTPTTFELNGLTASGAGTGGTCTRYFSGVYGQNFAAGGSNPWDANVQILDDGAFANIENTIFSLTRNGITTSIDNGSFSGSPAGLLVQDTGSDSARVTPFGFFSSNGSVTVCNISASSGDGVVAMYNAGGSTFSQLDPTSLTLDSAAMVLSPSTFSFTNPPAFSIGAATGFTGTILLAQLTPGGTQGNITTISGWITAYTPPT